MTDRLLRAIACPWVDVLGHPTGRLILKREPHKADMTRVIEAAAAAGVAMEINAQIDRLDLDDLHARRARDAGARIVISTDAHSTTALGRAALGGDGRATRLADAGGRAEHPFDRRAAPAASDRRSMSTDKIAEIRKMYFEATPKTIQRDLERAIDLLKSLKDDEERGKAAVYMEGLERAAEGVEGEVEVEAVREPPLDLPLGQHLLGEQAQAFLGVAVGRQRLQVLLVQPLHERHRDGRRGLRVTCRARG